MSSNFSADFTRNLQFRKFQAYGFLKNLRFFEAFLLLFFLSIGLSYTQIGTLYAAREVTRYFFEIPSGVMADAWGRRRTLATSFIFYILSFIFFFTGKGFNVMLMAMIFFAIGDAFRSGTHKAMIFEYLRIKGWEDQRVEYYGRTRAASQVGSAVSSLIAAGIVFLTRNYQVIFLFSIIPYILDFILILSYPSELEGNGKSLTEKALIIGFRETFKDFILSFKNIEILRRIMILSSFSGYHKSVKDYLQAIIASAVLLIPFSGQLETEQKTSLLVGIVYSMIFLMNSIAANRSGRFQKRTGNPARALFITLGAGFSAGAIAGVFYICGWKILAILPFLLIYIIENIRKPIGIVYIAESMNKNILASSLSAESQISSILGGILAVVIGFLADSYSVGASLAIVSGFLIFMQLILTNIYIKK